MSLSLNGESVEIRPREWLVDLVQRCGFQLTEECNHPDFVPVAISDSCAVEVDGILARACTTRAKDGMRISVAWPLAQSVPTEQFDETKARGIIAAEMGHEGPLLPILHALQAELGFIPRAAEPLIASMLNISRAEVHGVVSFYHDFRRAPAGRHVLKICRAEACQSMGGEANAEKLLHHLGIDWGGSTAGAQLTVEPVYCLGLCATAPGAMLDGEPMGRVTAEQLQTVAGELAAEARR